MLKSASLLKAFNLYRCLRFRSISGLQPKVVKSRDHRENPSFTHNQVLPCKLVIVGRPNVGKSTLFNRLTGSRAAIVSDIPGTTRDRREGRGILAGLPLNVVDTGGLDESGVFSGAIVNQVEAAVSDADIILLMVDARVGLHPMDLHYAKWLRKTLGKHAIDEPLNQRLLVLANKSESESTKVLESFNEFQLLGFGPVVPISAAHGEGMVDLFHAIQGVFNGSQESTTPVISKFSAEEGNDAMGIHSHETKDEPTQSAMMSLEDRTIQLAFMGRPNVGKSTLLNAVLGCERVIVGPTPGLTRDAVRAEWSFCGRNMVLVDTAGLTHLIPDSRLLCSDADVVAKVEKSNPRYLPGSKDLDCDDDPSHFSHRVAEMSLVSALNALRFAQVVVLVVEVTQGKFSKVDLQLVRKCVTEGRALVVAANKADLLPEGVTRSQYEQGVREHCESFLPEMGGLRVVCCVAHQRQGVNKLLHAVIEAHDAWSKRIPTWVLNGWFKDLMVTMPAARADGKPIKIKYITQVKARPPTFALFANTAVLPSFLERFLRSRLQRDYSLHGVPLRLIVRRAVVPERYRRIGTRPAAQRVAGSGGAGDVDTGAQTRERIGPRRLRSGRMATLKSRRVSSPRSRSASAPRSRSASAPRSRSASAPRSRSASAPRSRSTSLPRSRSASAPRSRSASAPRSRSTSAPRSRSASALRSRSASAPRSRSASAPRSRSASVSSASNYSKASRSTKAVPRRETKRTYTR